MTTGLPAQRHTDHVERDSVSLRCRHADLEEDSRRHFHRHQRVAQRGLWQLRDDTWRNDRRRRVRRLLSACQRRCSPTGPANRRFVGSPSRSGPASSRRCPDRGKSGATGDGGVAVFAERHGCWRTRPRASLSRRRWVVWPADCDVVAVPLDLSCLGIMTVWRSDLDLSVFRRRQKGMREEIFHGRMDILCDTPSKIIPLEASTCRWSRRASRRQYWGSGVPVAALPMNHVFHSYQLVEWLEWYFETIHIR